MKAQDIQTLIRENDALRGALRLAMATILRMRNGQRVDTSAALKFLERIRAGSRAAVNGTQAELEAD